MSANRSRQGDGVVAGFLSDEILEISRGKRNGTDLAALSKRLYGHVIDLQSQPGCVADR